MDKIIWVFISILFAHYIADFIMQPDRIARSKHDNFISLLQHAALYGCSMYLLVFIPLTVVLMYSPISVLKYTAINTVAHLVCDFFSSKLSHKYFSKENYWAGFAVVGFDQFVHVVVLLLTFVGGGL